LTMSNERVFTIEKISPSLGFASEMKMLEKFKVTCTTKTYTDNFDHNNFIIQIWTNATHKLNEDGKWHNLTLSLISNHINRYEHSIEFLPTSMGIFEFTIRAYYLKSNKTLKMIEDKDWIWAGNYGHNGKVYVMHPNNFDKLGWTTGPQYNEIYPNLFISNDAAKIGFNVVLNCAAELEFHYKVQDNIIYKKLSIADGAHNPIPPTKLQEAVAFVDEQLSKGYKVCINCRAGIGRSGSVGIAYIFYKNPLYSYETTLDKVWSCKANIYPHTGLRKTLYQLYPRTD